LADLRRWLAEVGLENLADRLIAQDVGLDILPELTDAELREVGLTLGERKRLLRAAAALAAAPQEARPATPPTAERQSGEAERRQITILFCDMVGSTILGSRLDPEDMFAVIASYHRCCMEVIQRYGGHVAQYVGDGVLAYFGFPLAREDDAERAAAAGLQLVEAVRRLKTRPDVNLHARVGIETGLVVIGDLVAGGVVDEETVVGDTPNLANRLQAMAPPDGVVVGPNTHRLLGELFLFEPLGPREIRGFEAPIPVWRVLREGRAQGRFEARSAAGLTPLIGREHEFQMILERWHLARQGEGQVLMLSGEGGIGKSRLVDTLNRQLGGANHQRLRWFCSQFFAGTALYPVIEQVRRAAGFSREDPNDVLLGKLDALLLEVNEDPRQSGALLATLCSIPAQDRYPAQEMSPLERKAATFDLLIRQIETSARRMPLLLVLEDAHWIDPTTSELIGLLINRVRDLPVLLVVTFRPEFVPPWKMQPHVTALQLNRFGRQQAAELMHRVTGGRALPPAVAQMILEKTDGVPLFVEELTKALIESGALRNEGDALVLAGPLPLISIPSTLHDSLMARLDRLSTVKEVALWASALGRTFTLDLLTAVSPLSPADVEIALDRLVDAEMVYRHGLGADQLYEFKHALVQEAAYLSMLRARRQQMHARIAEVLEQGFPDSVVRRPEIMAHHFSEAGLIEKAIDYNLMAGDAAAARYASPEAHVRYARAAALARDIADSPRARRRELKAILKCASVAVGAAQVDADLVQLHRARELAQALEHRPRLAQVHYWTGRLHYVSGRFDPAIREAEQSLGMADADGDERQSAAAANLLARIHCLRGEPARGIAYAERNVDQMGRLGNRIEQASISGVLAFALALAGRFDEAHAAADHGIELADELDHLPTQAACQFFRGVALGWQGEGDAAEPFFARALELADQSGDSFRRYLIHGWRGEARLRCARLAEAVDDLGAAQERAIQIGSDFHRGGFMALLAEAHLATGVPDLALRLSEEALELARRSEQAWSQSLALRARAAALATCDPGQSGQAIDLLRRAIAIQVGQGLVCDLAWSRLWLGRLLDRTHAAEGEQETSAARAIFAEARMRVPIETKAVLETVAAQ
jgi:class 3 adenylate cyclase/tetratricopeptide (TPR) repeat protein